MTERPTSKDFSKCFVCGQANPGGLRVVFRYENGLAKAEFTPDPDHQGWADFLHGGLAFTLMDEAMAYAVYFRGPLPMTAKIEARLRKPIPTGQTITIVGEVLRQRKQAAEARASIRLQDGTLAAEAKGLVFYADAEQTEGA
ncbi:MAG: PaaI family thioesterase [Chloroflexi bacterium]|nr:PaaI family thioesterase [Chloroflexota bacterium]